MAILAVQDPTFQPAMRIITAITNAEQAVVTTSFDHDYLTGLIVRLYIPLGFGMQQANGYSGRITVLGDTTFRIALDTRGFDPFVIPAENPGHYFTQAQVVPVGEVNSSLRQSTRNVLPYR